MRCVRSSQQRRPDTVKHGTDLAFRVKVLAQKVLEDPLDARDIQIDDGRANAEPLLQVPIMFVVSWFQVVL